MSGKNSNQNQENNKSDGISIEEMAQIKQVQLKANIRRTAIGGSLAGVITFTGAWIIGDVSGSEAAVLLKTALPAARSFTGNILISTSTILALMLTLLSFSYKTNVNLKWVHYQRIKHIALIDALTLIASILIFLLLNIPIEESSQPPVRWYTGFYYASLILSSLLGASIITVILMLYETIRDVIDVIRPGDTDDKRQSRLVKEADETEEE